MRISRLFKRLRRWSSQAFRKRHSPAAFRTCISAGNSLLTVEGTTSKGTGSISCEVEFCIFYRLNLRTLRTKDVYRHLSPVWLYQIFPHYLINSMDFGRKLQNTRYAIWFSLQLLCETFIILRRIQQDIIINVRRSCKVPLFLSDCDETLIFSTDFRKKLK
jgi:hypothetical protein